MGRWLRTTGHLPSQVLCSTARRARETWRLAQAELGAAPPVTFSSGIYQASPADLLGLARRTPPATAALLVVGHDPAIQELALTLAGSQRPALPAGVINRMQAKFPTAAIAVLEFTGGWDQLAGHGARLVCFVTPREVKASANGPR